MRAALVALLAVGCGPAVSPCLQSATARSSLGDAPRTERAQKLSAYHDRCVAECPVLNGTTAICHEALALRSDAGDEAAQEQIAENCHAGDDDACRLIEGDPVLESRLEAAEQREVAVADRQHADAAAELAPVTAENARVQGQLVAQGYTVRVSMAGAVQANMPWSSETITLHAGEKLAVYVVSTAASGVVGHVEVVGSQNRELGPARSSEPGAQVAGAKFGNTSTQDLQITLVAYATAEGGPFPATMTILTLGQ